MLIKNNHEWKTNHRGIEETLRKFNRPDIPPYTNVYGDVLMLTETPSQPFELVHMSMCIYNSKNNLTIVDSFKIHSSYSLFVGHTKCKNLKDIVILNKFILDIFWTINKEYSIWIGSTRTLKLKWKSLSWNKQQKIWNQNKSKGL